MLCVPRGDLRRNIERVPSRWILQIASALAGERWWSDELLAAKRDWLTHVASFDAGLRHMAFPATEQEHRLRSLMAQGSTRLSLPALTATGDATLGAGAEVVAARRSDRFTRFDGNLAGLHLPSPAERVTSATRLEGWAACPFAYLLRNVLGVDEVENPEDELQITPRDKGSLVHQALEDFIGEVLGRPTADQPGPSEPWSASDRARMVEIGERVCGRVRGSRPHRAADLLAPGQEADPRRPGPIPLGGLRRTAGRHGTRPLAAELAFGLPGVRSGHRRARPARRAQRRIPGQGRPGRRRPPTARSTSSTTRRARPTTTGT